MNSWRDRKQSGDGRKASQWRRRIHATPSSWRCQTIIDACPRPHKPCRLLGSSTCHQQIATNAEEKDDFSGCVSANIKGMRDVRLFAVARDDTVTKTMNGRGLMLGTHRNNWDVRERRNSILNKASPVFRMWSLRLLTQRIREWRRGATIASVQSTNQ